MTSKDFAAIAAYLIGSVGGASIIIAALSNWLGKVWAQRIMDKERAQHEKILAEFRAQLERANNNQIEELKTSLSISKEQSLKGFHDKIDTYRLFIDLISEILGDFDSSIMNKRYLNPERLDHFNRLRIKAYGYLAMVAPQQIMDAQDKLIDYLLVIIHQNKDYVWKEVRELAINLLNEVRKDLKFDVTPIIYRGEL